MRDLIIAGLLLPLRLYLQPAKFVDEVASLAPDLPRNYTSSHAQDRFTYPAFRRGVGQLIVQAGVALLWSPLLAGLLLILGYHVNWLAMVLGMAGGVGFGVLLGLTHSVALSIATPVVLGVMFGVLAGTMHSMGSDVVGGVVNGMAYGRALGIVFNVLSSGVGNLAFGVVAGVVLVSASGVAVGVLVSMAYGVAFSAIAILITAHLVLYPFQVLLSFICWAVIRHSPRHSMLCWQISPVRWDEIILLLLPGLVGLLVTLNHQDSKVGREAIAQVAAHRFQHRAAQQALVRLAQSQAMLVDSLPALATFRREVSWLSEETGLPAGLQTLLLRMRDISQEVASALESDSATNQVRRFRAAADMLDSIRSQPGIFGPALTRWSQLIAEGLEQAQEKQREAEPIPQVYVSDGRPIQPADRPDTALPFKGRAALFRQLEGALGGKEGERSTFMLYGQRRTGKSSALLQLPRRLGSQLVPAFLDLQSDKLSSANSIVGLLEGLADEVREEARRHRGLSLPAIERAALAADPYPALGRWLDKVEEKLAERTLLLCLDEFEALEEAIRDGRLDTRILSTIRNIVQYRRRVAVLLSGSHQIDELPPHWASALITTTTLHISFLEEVDTRELIEQPVAEFPAIYEPTTVDRIVHVTHCQPYLVQLTCALLVERMNAQRRMPPASIVTVDDVEAVTPKVLERGQNYFVDLWRTQTGSNLARHVLEKLACAPDEQLSREQLRRIDRDESALREALATLLRRELIERTPDDYRITVPLIAEYVRQQALL